MKPEPFTKTDAAITTHEENVRARAYEQYEVRGRIDGHAEEDWLQAEGEVAGSLDIDSLGWTNLEFSCMDAILDHKREGHQGERCPGD